MSPYERCHRLFAEYPLAAKVIDQSGLIRSIVLLLSDGSDTRFFILIARSAKGRTSFSLLPWRAEGGVNIGPDSDTVPDAFSTALTRGIPVPRDGSLFGWACGKTVNALIGVQARYTPTSPVPSWAVMPLTSSPALEWPPFTRNRRLGPWFWEYHRAGTIVLLDALIAGTSGLVFWVETEDTLGSDCCAVAQDIVSEQGHALPRGVYVHYKVLSAAKPVPPLAKLLSSPSKVDLGPRFQLSEQRGNRPPDEGGATLSGLEARRQNQQRHLGVRSAGRPQNCA